MRGAPSALCLRQARGQRQGTPTLQAVMHVLLGESPQGFEQGDQQQGLFTVSTWRTTWAFG